jgi:hypothetical protein
MEEFSDYMRDRYRRIYRAANGISYGKMDVPPDHLLLGRLATRDWSNCKVLDKMLMYERRLESSLYRAKAELLKQQEKRRTAEKAPAVRAPSDGKTNLKKQSQSPAFGGTTPEPLPDVCCPASSRKSEARGSKLETGGTRATNFAKQSQFEPDSMCAKLSVTDDYDETPSPGRRKNKANRSQFSRPISGRAAEERVRRKVPSG